MTYADQFAAAGSAAGAVADKDVAGLNATIAGLNATIASLRASAVQPLAVSGSPVAGKSWSKVWGDEFNYIGPADPTKWSTGRWAPTTTADEPWNHGKEGAYLASSQVKADGANLVIATGSGAPKTINGVVYPTASGLIQSAGHYSMVPGQFIEANIYIPTAYGCWPAMWLLPMPVNTWPPEIDILEIDTRTGKRPAFNYHPLAGGPSGPDSYGETTSNYLGAFHVYGLHWGTDGILTPYLDGKPYAVRQLPVDPRPHYLLINLSTYAGTQPPAGTQMKVDWVRAWA
jgi:beta-glucanase (GH16 family)